MYTIKPIASFLLASAMLHAVVFYKDWGPVRPAHPNPAFSTKTINVSLTYLPEPQKSEAAQTPIQKPTPLKTSETTLMPVLSTTNKSGNHFVPISKPKPKSPSFNQNKKLKPSDSRSEPEPPNASLLGSAPVVAEASSTQKNRTEAFEQWLASLQQLINRQKEYPYQARRRHLSGNVQVRITVHPNGSLIKTDIVGGKKVFHQSTLKAVKTAFPMPPTGNTEPITIHLAVHYNLR